MAGHPRRGMLQMLQTTTEARYKWWVIVETEAMQAIEFESIIQDQSIPLPKSPMLPPGQAVRVVVMYEQVAPAEASEKRDDAISRLIGHPLRIPDFTPLSRDEAHER